MKTYWTIWESEIMHDEWHWVLSMPNSRYHDYSGIASSWEEANRDVDLSIEHWIFTRPRSNRTL